MAQNPPRELSEAELIRSALGAYDGIYAAQFRLAQYNPDLLTSQKGYGIYDEMLTQAACRAPLNVKRYAVLHKGWSVVPAVSDPKDIRHDAAKQIADAVTYALSNILDTRTDEPQDFRSVLFETLSACWTGFQVTEKEWRVLDEGPYKGLLGFRRFSAKPCQQIGFELDPDSLAVLAIKPYTIGGGYGPPVAPQKVIRYTYNPVKGLPYGQGDGRSCYKHSIRLDATMKWWAVALEIWGIPFIKAKYPSGNKKALADALEVLKLIRQGAPAIFPSDVEADVVAGNAGGVLDVFRTTADWDTQQIARAVLGSTLTSGEGKRSGSLALGKVHESTQDYGLMHVKEDVEAVVTSTVIRRFVRYNFGAAALDLCPRLSLGEWDESDRVKLADMFSKLIGDRVIARRSKFIREELGLPPLDAEEEAMLDEEDERETEIQRIAADARNTAPGASRGGTAPASDGDEDEDETNPAEDEDE
jgi:phage gp29-like protein